MTSYGKLSQDVQTGYRDGKAKFNDSTKKAGVWAEDKVFNNKEHHHKKWRIFNMILLALTHLIPFIAGLTMMITGLIYSGTTPYDVDCVVPHMRVGPSKVSVLGWLSVTGGITMTVHALIMLYYATMKCLEKQEIGQGPTFAQRRLSIVFNSLATVGLVFWYIVVIVFLAIFVRLMQDNCSDAVSGLTITSIVLLSVTIVLMLFKQGPWDHYHADFDSTQAKEVLDPLAQQQQQVRIVAGHPYAYDNMHQRNDHSGGIPVNHNEVAALDQFLTSV